MRKYHLDRAALQNVFCEGLERAGYDIYGYAQTFDAPVPEGFPTSASKVDGFCVLPYVWDIPKNQEWLRNAPNFIDTATNTRIWWYKYALRDGEATRPLTVQDVEDMMARLCAATRKLGSLPYAFD